MLIRQVLRVLRTGLVEADPIVVTLAWSNLPGPFRTWATMTSDLADINPSRPSPHNSILRRIEYTSGSWYRTRWIPQRDRICQGLRLTGLLECHITHGQNMVAAPVDCSQIIQHEALYPPSGARADSIMLTIQCSGTPYEVNSYLSPRVSCVLFDFFWPDVDRSGANMVLVRDCKFSDALPSTQACSKRPARWTGTRFDASRKPLRPKSNANGQITWKK